MLQIYSVHINIYIYICVYTHTNALDVRLLWHRSRQHAVHSAYGLAAVPRPGSSETSEPAVPIWFESGV